jgi:hypothetical protein
MCCLLVLAHHSAQLVAILIAPTLGRDTSHVDSERISRRRINRSIGRRPIAERQRYCPTDLYLSKTLI